MYLSPLISTEGKCSKCKSVEPLMGKRLENFEYYQFCKLCNEALEKDDKNNAVEEFLKEDFGDSPISQVQKDMINAKKRRVIGKSPWK